MIQYTVMYPYTPHGRFDHDYYRDHHLPLLAQRLGDACKGYTICKGLSSGVADQPPVYVTMCHVLLDSMQAFQEAFAPHIAEIRADIPNFTDITPLRQISEIRT